MLEPSVLFVCANDQIFEEADPSKNGSAHAASPQGFSANGTWDSFLLTYILRQILEDISSILLFLIGPLHGDYRYVHIRIDGVSCGLQVRIP